MLRQYQSIYNEALGEMPDINHLIAINTRYIGEAALDAERRRGAGAGGEVLQHLPARHAQHAQVRTAYNVLNQYRQLAERALERGQHGAGRRDRVLLQVLRRRSRTAWTSASSPRPWPTTWRPCASARSPLQRRRRTTRCSKLLLELDKEAESQAQEHDAARRAQGAGQAGQLLPRRRRRRRAHARQIFDDMKDERPERLRSIRDELLRIESKDFWEVIDRGTNFDYVDAARKAQLKVFFSWFPSLTRKEACHMREAS